MGFSKNNRTAEQKEEEAYLAPSTKSRVIERRWDAHKTRRLLEKLAREEAEGKNPKEAQKLRMELAEDLRLKKGDYVPTYLMSLRMWHVLDEEFAKFIGNYLDACYRNGEKFDFGEPRYNLVLRHVQRHVHLDPKATSVASNNVFGRRPGDHGYCFGSEGIHKDVVVRYAEMVVRAIWRLYDPRESRVGVRWLMDPSVVRTVKDQVYILYHALLFRRCEAKMRDLMHRRHQGEFKALMLGR